MKNIIQTLIIASLFSSNLFAQTYKVLVVMSAADTLELTNGKKYQTGVFLNEFYLTYKAISEAGYDIDFATPNGLASTIDRGSLDDKYWKNQLEIKNEAIRFVVQNEEFNSPLSLEAANKNQNQYIGLVIPGGQGLMVDLINDKNVSTLLKDFSSQGRAIGLICHAPSLILSIPKEENPFIGYRINSVTPFEEFYIERFVMKGKPEKRKIAKQLKQLGLKYEKGGPGRNFAVRDKELITSQNPFSSSAFNSFYLEALSEYLKNGSLR